MKYAKELLNSIGAVQPVTDRDRAKVALRGRSMTVENAHLVAGDLSTSGVFPKAWVRRPDGFWLYKDGDAGDLRGQSRA